MAVKIGINGFGRIGRLVLRAMFEKPGQFEIVAINDLADADMLAYLCKYDSTQGRFNGKVEAKGNSIVVNGKEIKILAEKDPAKLPWGALKVDVVIEGTGIFTENKKKADGDKPAKPGYDTHLDAGARKVLITAPTKGTAKLIVIGVNDDKLTAADTCISNASCTTNSLAPVVKVLHEKFGILKGLMTTCHAYTNDQKKSKARARAGAMSIIPTTTGAASAIGQVIPELKGKLDGFSLRVPVPVGSITDLSICLAKKVTKDEINAAIKAAAEGPMKGIIEYTTDEIVSADIVHNPASSIFDANNTMVVDGDMAKVTMWYDNEWG
ncbi:MAG: type I glyceraldehyde-3-phosphate dehydrogenase, partial [Planctomycetota bacterium]|nr:type I glyceraldehyde-3-phosphate dehydrogenase [Planctomycetota bacterium]